MDQLSTEEFIQVRLRFFGYQNRKVSRLQSLICQPPTYATRNGVRLLLFAIDPLAFNSGTE